MSNVTCLIIDDDTTFAELLKNRVIKQFKRVDCAFDSYQALQAMSTHHYDCVILDLNLGTESGLTLIPELLAKHSTCRILVLTGYASIQSAVDAIKLGAVQYLPKPATSEQVMQALNADNHVDYSISNQRLSPEQLEWEHIQSVLHEHQGNVSAAARALNMHRRTLQRKLAKRSPLRPDNS